MTTVKDLVEDWIQMRAKLQEQIRWLESGAMQIERNDVSATEDTLARLKGWLHELNELLKEYAPHTR